MQDLLGHDSSAILPPEEADAELLRAWVGFANVWALEPEATDAERRGTFYLLLEEKTRKIMNLRPHTLVGIKTKLILALCCGPDAGVFCRHYREGRPLPDLLAFRDRNSSQLFDAIEAIDKLMAAERKGI